VRDELNDSIESLRPQFETNMLHITSMQAKAAEDLKENERRLARLSTNRIDEHVYRIKKEAKRMINDQTRGVAEVESRMRQELKAEYDREREFKDQITILATTHTDGAEVVVGLESTAEQLIRSNLNDLKKEMDDVKQQGNSFQDKLKEYLTIQEYKEDKDEVDKDLNDFKETKTEFENAKHFLHELNDDKKAMELAQEGVKKVFAKIEAVEKKRRDDSHKWKSLNDEMESMKRMMGDCKILAEKVEELEITLERVTEAEEKLTKKTQELQQTLPTLSTLTKNMENRIEEAVMQIQSQGEAVKDSIHDDLPKMMTETGQKLMEKQEQVLISIIEK